MINGTKNHMGTTFHTKLNNPIDVYFFPSLQLETLQMKHFSLCKPMSKIWHRIKKGISYNIFQLDVGYAFSKVFVESGNFEHENFIGF